MEDKFETVVNTLRAVERKEDSKHCKKNFQENENLQRRTN